MVFWDVFLAFLIGMLFTAGFVMIARRPVVWLDMFVLFLVFFLAAWTGSLWIVPIGPAVLGARIVPLLLITLIIALLVTAWIRPLGVKRPRTRGEALRRAEAKSEIETVTNAFLWALVVFMALAVVGGYVFQQI
ncbi:MAG: hypothetical protein GF363_09945 [Chitinivibrionales bacterium]|nr:hypothetical protein [Chitinivibrionales bacterium]